MRIYTRKGDKGQTSMLAGKQVSKSDKKIEVLGTIDELNAWIGWLVSQRVSGLEDIQSDLMQINSGIAGYRIKNLESRIKDLESEIDKMQEKLPVLKNFILPQNQIHIARAVCRRAERVVVNAKLQTKNSKIILPYLNRLSDYLFVLARYEDFRKKKKEIIWKF